MGIVRLESVRLVRICARICAWCVTPLLARHGPPLGPRRADDAAASCWAVSRHGPCVHAHAPTLASAGVQLQQTADAPLATTRLAHLPSSQQSSETWICKMPRLTCDAAVQRLIGPCCRQLQPRLTAVNGHKCRTAEACCTCMAICSSDICQHAENDSQRLHEVRHHTAHDPGKHAVATCCRILPLTDCLLDAPACERGQLRLAPQTTHRTDAMP